MQACVEEEKCVNLQFNGSYLNSHMQADYREKSCEYYASEFSLNSHFEVYMHTTTVKQPYSCEVYRLIFFILKWKDKCEYTWGSHILVTCVEQHFYGNQI